MNSREKNTKNTTRVKIINNTEREDFEKAVELFLNDKQYIIDDIQYSYARNNYSHYTAMIVYRRI